MRRATISGRSLCRSSPPISLGAMRITANCTLRRRLPYTVSPPKRTGLSRISQLHIEIADRDSKNGAPNLLEGVFQTLRGFLQLALERIDLLRDIIKLFFSQRSCLRKLLNFAIRFAHYRPNSHCNSREPALSGHVRPPSRITSSYTRTIPGVINITGLLTKHDSNELSSRLRISLSRTPTRGRFI